MPASARSRASPEREKKRGEKKEAGGSSRKGKKTSKSKSAPPELDWHAVLLKSNREKNPNAAEERAGGILRFGGSHYESLRRMQPERGKVRRKRLTLDRVQCILE